MRPVILLFAKAPVPGQVKTRLSPILTPEQAAWLHKAFVFDTLESLNHCGDVELWSDQTHPAWPVPCRIQAEGDLGVKMLNALRDGLAAGRPRVMIVGADSPTVPVAAVLEMLSLDADVALGPTDDGGYWSIACRRVHPAMFAGVPWSTAETLAATERAVLACGLTVARGPAWWDVDTPRDLARLRAEPRLPRYTREALARIQRSCLD